MLQGKLASVFMPVTPEQAPGQAGDGLESFKEMLEEQRERQTRLRHIEQFLSSPLFIDMRDQPVAVSDPPEVIEERKRDLDYHIRVLQSLMSILIEEREALDRTLSAAAHPAPEPDPAPYTEPDPLPKKAVGG